MLVFIDQLDHRTRGTRPAGVTRDSAAQRLDIPRLQPVKRSPLCLALNPFPSLMMVRRGLARSRSFVLAALRALHLDRAVAAGVVLRYRERASGCGSSGRLVLIGPGDGFVVFLVVA
jgi:hypothetical protein